MVFRFVLIHLTLFSIFVNIQSYLQLLKIIERCDILMNEERNGCKDIVYGSAKYDCFENLKTQGINIIDFPSQTAKAFEGRSVDE